MNNQPEETKLLPCPFCGWEHPQIIDDVETKPKEQTHVSYWGYCTKCSAEGRWSETFSGAKVFWNTRATPSQPPNETGKSGFELFQIWSGGVYGWDVTSEIEKTRWSRLAVALRDSQPSPTWVKDAAEEIYNRYLTSSPCSPSKELVEQILTRHAKGK